MCFMFVLLGGFFVYLGDKMIWNFMILYRCIYEDVIIDRDCDMMNKLEIFYGNICILKFYIKMNFIYVCLFIEFVL